MKLYPDKLFYMVENQARRDEAGNWIMPSEPGEWVERGDCRIELMLEGSKMVGNDKQFLSVNSVIYAPLWLNTLPAMGQRVKVIRHDGSEVVVNTINAARGMLHVRIWAE